MVAGSIGRTLRSCIATALTHFRARRVPFVSLTSYGGARIQEGKLKFVTTVHAAEHIRTLRKSGLPAPTSLGHPSTSGVLASSASLSDMVLADPDATVGFADPTVTEAVTGAPVGPDSH